MQSRNLPVHEPHKFKTIRPIAFPTLEERKRNLSAARFNVFQLTPRQVTFDMVSFGTSAMTQEQLAGQPVGDEAYPGARNFETLNEVITRVLGQTYVCPTHNSLGAVELLLRAFAGWRPIDTAPKDGTTILCYSYNKYRSNVHIAVATWLGGGWECPHGDESLTPTHWQPLRRRRGPSDDGRWRCRCGRSRIRACAVR